MSLDADDLVAMFSSIRVNDHESLMTQFSTVLGCEREVARFFLESSNWSVEGAVNTFLQTVGAQQNINSHPPPQVQMLTDTRGHPLPGLSPMYISLIVRNIGGEAWPEDATLVFIEGSNMDGPRSYRVGGLPAGEVAEVQFIILIPPTPGTHAGCWRFTCGTGYFGDPIWIMLNVVSGLPPAEPNRPICQFGASCNSEVRDHYMSHTHPTHPMEDEYQKWRASAHSIDQSLANLTVSHDVKGAGTGAGRGEMESDDLDDLL